MRSLPIITVVSIVVGLACLASATNPPPHTVDSIVPEQDTTQLAPATKLWGSVLGFGGSHDKAKAAPEFDIASARRYLNYSFAAYCHPGDLKAGGCHWGEACKLDIFRVISTKHNLLAYLAWHPHHKEMVLAFRGTLVSSLHNIQTDLDVKMVKLFGKKKWKVHKGFSKGYSDLKKDIVAALADLRKAHAEAPLIVTGHSLGGALSSVAVADLVMNEKVENVVSYSFGSPRVFNQEAAQEISKAAHIFRVVNTVDPVPHMPLCEDCSDGGDAHKMMSDVSQWFTGKKKTDYWHVAKEVWIPKKCTWEQCSEDSAYKVCDDSGEDPHCMDSVEGTDLLNGLDAHSDGYMGVQAGDLLDSCGAARAAPASHKGIKKSDEAGLGGWMPGRI